MNDCAAAGSYYTIRHVSLCTGLTDRTIRSYISAGFLKGEKINGLWHFTPKQVDAFIRHPAVRPSIQAKQNALICDFLMDTKKAAHQSCVILDLPGEDQKSVAEFFCYAINAGSFHGIRFAFDGTGDMPRVILTGPAREVMELAERWYQRREDAPLE